MLPKDATPINTERPSDDFSMRVVKNSSCEEYARWYLQRDSRKKHLASFISHGSSDPVKDPVKEMKQNHSGKWRHWFEASTTEWNIVVFDSIALGDLVFLESKWTKDERLVVNDGPNYRLLSRVARNAKAGNYFERPSAHTHKAYYDELVKGTLLLEGNERVAICSAEANEIRYNPAAQFYLLDGVGRCLPYMVLSDGHGLGSIEAFRAVR